jgi:hypothetical protein
MFSFGGTSRRAAFPSGGVETSDPVPFPLQPLAERRPGLEAEIAAGLVEPGRGMKHVAFLGFGPLDADRQGADVFEEGKEVPQRFAVPTL